MANRRPKPEEIVSKPRHIDFVVTCAVCTVAVHPSTHAMAVHLGLDTDWRQQNHRRGNKGIAEMKRVLMWSALVWDGWQWHMRSPKELRRAYTRPIR